MQKKFVIEYEEVMRTFNPGEISFIKSLFAANHIRYQIQGENFSYVDPMIAPSRISVDKRQIEIVKELLKDLNKTRLEAIDKEKNNPNTEGSFGITLIAIVEILLSGMLVSFKLWMLLMGQPSPHLLEKLGYLNLEQFYFKKFFMIVLELPVLIAAFGVLNRKEWARRLLLISLIAADVIYNVVIYYQLLPYSTHANYLWTSLSYLWIFWIIYYLTRLKIVAQFK